MTVVFVDSNVFLRFFAPSEEARLVRQQQIAYSLFMSIRDGTTKATTSDIVLHEVSYVMLRQYESTHEDILQYWRTLLGYPGWVFANDDGDVYLTALDLYELRPSLQLSDALIAARAQLAGATLATFDKKLANAMPAIVWKPDDFA